MNEGRANERRSKRAQSGKCFLTSCLFSTSDVGTLFQFAFFLLASPEAVWRPSPALRSKDKHDHAGTLCCVFKRTNRPRTALELFDFLDQDAGCRLGFFDLDLFFRLLLAPPHGQARPADKKRQDLQGYQRRGQAPQGYRDRVALGPALERRGAADPAEEARGGGNGGGQVRERGRNAGGRERAPSLAPLLSFYTKSAEVGCPASFSPRYLSCKIRNRNKKIKIIAHIDEKEKQAQL